MTSISFEAVAHDGTIRIQDKYVKQIKPNGRVVLCPVDTHFDRKSGPISFYGFGTTDYQFDREEANVR